MSPTRQRQKILILYLANSALDSAVKGWSMYDGAGGGRAATGEEEAPPYRTGLEALKDGWRVLQFPQLHPPYPGLEHATSFYGNEFIFEQIVEVEW